MRKDVRIGAIIGGVIIGGVIVYTIVASMGRAKPNTAVTLDGAKSNPAGTVPGGAVVPPTSPLPAVPDVPTSPGPSTDLVTGTPGGAPAAPTSPGSQSPLGTPEVASGTPAPGADPIRTPASDPGAGRNSANWAALLSADHVEGDLQPIRTHTPSPAAAPIEPPPAPGIVLDPPLEAPPAQVADASGSDPGARAGSSPKPVDPPPSAASKTHTIASGETFSSISRAVYGDAKYFKEIVKANPAVDPTHLKLGTVITLPDAATFKHDKAAEKAAAPAKVVAPPAPINPKTEYRVQSTDSLYKISVKLYHTPNKVEAIYQLNKDAIGTDPAKLKLNMVLKLPEPPVEGNAAARG